MRKYKLDDSLIFKPDKLQLTPEEELEAERNFELFCAMMEKNGVACLSDPSYEITREQIDEEICRDPSLAWNDKNCRKKESTAP